MSSIPPPPRLWTSKSSSSSILGPLSPHNSLVVASPISNVSSSIRSLGSLISSPPASPTEASTSSPTGSSISEKLQIFRRNSGSRLFGGYSWCVPENDEMRQLDLHLTDRDIRQDLVQQFLATNQADFAFYVRFLSLYNDFRQTEDRKEKISKGKGIMGAFIHSGSLFQLKGIPEQDLASLKLENLPLVKAFVLSELCKNPIVVENMKQ